jgi:hypothetical protein
LSADRGGSVARGNRHSALRTQPATAGATSAAADVVITAAMPNTPDSDGDADVDCSDYAAFFDCLSGAAAVNMSFACEVFDVEQDADINLADFGRFAETFSRP